MLPLSPAHGLVVFLCLVATSAASAQALPGPSMPADAARASPAASPMVAPPPSAASTGGLNYRSAFEGYVPFSDGSPTSWREANDTVGRRGGWKAHAGEAAGPAAATGPHAHGHGRSHPSAMPGAAPAKERP